MRIKLRPEDQNRQALVTGASSGIGREYARVLAGLGFDLVITARRLDRLEQLASELTSAHRVDAQPIHADLASEAGAEHLLREISDRGLDVDVLVNNAGVGASASFLDLDWETHEAHISLMAVNPARLIYQLLPGMLERGYGRVINVTSIAAHMPGLPMHGMYCPTKTFLFTLTQSLATEYAGSGVTFTATVPGITESELLDTGEMRELVDRLPSFVTADTRTVARQGVAAAFAGKVTYTHMTLNRIHTALLRHAPARFAHRLTAPERRRVQAQLAGDRKQHI